MKQFMDKDFLLQTETSKKLYREFASNMPIIDYHCHLNPKEIWEDKTYENITQVWLYGDHYKWRAMRSAGISEDYITGDRSDYEKFIAWSKTLPLCIGNPLYHWAHLELQRYFGIYETLSEKTADVIWEKTEKILKSGNFTARKLIATSNVVALCTTDDPIDSLEYHIALKNEGRFNVKVLPTFRPDKAINIEAEAFREYIKDLGSIADIKINGIDNLIAALCKRVDFFHLNGCRLSDHAFIYVPFQNVSQNEADAILKKKLLGDDVSCFEEEQYKTYVMLRLGEKFNDLGWTMQLHIGAMRNNSTRMFKKLGPDTGFDSIHDHSIAASLSKFMDALDTDNKLPKTILYTLNPVHNFVLGTMLGNFQSSDAASKIQFGTAWWFCDHRDGMEEQIKTLASLGLLPKFIGMLTDSRSFLSYPRHEYFRRILCNIVGKWVENGEYPDDYEALRDIIEGISYKNVVQYLKL